MTTITTIFNGGYGNLNGSKSFDEGDWATRVVPQAGLIAAMDVSWFVAIELYIENNMYTYLTDALGGSWGVSLGTDGVQLLYRLEDVRVIFQQNVRMPGDKWLCKWQLEDVDTGVRYWVFGTQFSAGGTNSAVRIQQANFCNTELANYYEAILCVDRNSVTSDPGYPKAIMNSKSWLGLREKSLTTVPNIDVKSIDDTTDSVAVVEGQTPLDLKSAKWTLIGQLVPTDRSKTPQWVDQDSVTGDWYVSQELDNGNLIIYRYGSNFKYISKMTVPNGGHGMPMTITNVSGTVYCKIKYNVTTVHAWTYPNETGSTYWVNLPYIAGKVWTKTEIDTHTSSAQYLTPPHTNNNWLQGEAYSAFNNTYYRSFGVPYGSNNQPTSNHEKMPQYIEVIKDGKIVQTVSAVLGKGSDGKPIGGRLEPEGLTTIIDGGITYLVSAICNYTKGKYLLNLYRAPLSKAGGGEHFGPPVIGPHDQWSEDMLTRNKVIVLAAQAIETDLSDHNLFFEGNFSITGTSYSEYLECCGPQPPSVVISPTTPVEDNDSEDINLSGVKIPTNGRDALVRTTHDHNRVFRSAELTSSHIDWLKRLRDAATTKKLVVFDLRESGGNPSVSGVSVIRCGLSTSGGKTYEYGQFADGTKQRKALRLAFETMSDRLTAGDNIVIHCQAGKDRTGSVVDLLLEVLNTPQNTRDTEYKSSSGGVDIDYLNTFRSHFLNNSNNIPFTEGGDKKTGGSFLRGLGVSQARIDALVATIG